VSGVTLVSSTGGLDRTLSEGFTTVYGRNLVGELPNFVHRPYLS
jgi:hypothetical protein